MYLTTERLIRLLLVVTTCMVVPGMTLASPVASLHSSLFAAITKDDLIQVKRLLAKGADPNALGTDGQRPLTLAAKLTRIEICAALLAKGADPYRANTGGWNALRVTSDNLETRSRGEQQKLDLPERKLIHIMLQADAQRHKVPLIGAIEAEDLHAVQQLLASGTNPDEQDSYGSTALMWAAYQGNQEICKLLVAHGAHVNRQDPNGYSALMLAASSATLPSHCNNLYISFLAVDHTAVVEDLLAAGADPNLTDKHGLAALANAGVSLSGLGFKHTMCMALIRHGARVDVPGYGGKSILEIAAYFLDKELLETLLNLHPTQTDKDAALASANSFRDELVTMDSDQREEFAQARLEVVQRLLKTGADPRGKDRTGVQALTLAIAAAVYERTKGHEIIRLLVEHGADVNARRGVGETPLMVAVEAGDVESVSYLLKQGAQVNATAILSSRTATGTISERTTTALMLAQSLNVPEIVNKLREAGAN